MKAHTVRVHSALVWIGLGLAAVTLVALAAAAAPADQANTERVALGRVTYRVYCANCHGAGGEGDGRIADLLTVKPADLTSLAKDNGGEFPADRVREAIDGREEVKGHGMREMPIWGDVFQDSPGEQGAEEKAQTKIDDLVAFLRTIQR